MKKNQLSKFFREHKKEVIACGIALVAAGCAIGGGIAVSSRRNQEVARVIQEDEKKKEKDETKEDAFTALKIKKQEKAKKKTINDIEKKEENSTEKKTDVASEKEQKNGEPVKETKKEKVPIKQATIKKQAKISDMADSRGGGESISGRPASSGKPDVPKTDKPANSNKPLKPSKPSEPANPATPNPSEPSQTPEPPKPPQSDEQEHVHEWVQKYKEVDKGEWKQEKVKDAWDEKVQEEHLICDGCGQDFGSGANAKVAAGKHCAKDSSDECEKYHSEQREVSIHHDAEYKNVWVENIVQEPDGFECSCGARK